MDFASAEAESAGMRGFVPVVTMLGALLVASGCGGGVDTAAEPDEGSRAAAPVDDVARLPQSSSPPTVATSVPVPAGFRTRRMNDAGVQISLPRGWIALARRDATFPGVAQTLLRIDAGIRPALAAISFPDSPMKLLVLAPTRGAGFPATVSVVVTGAAGAPASVAEWETEVQRSLIATARPIGGTLVSRRVRLGVGAGLRTAFEQVKDGRRLAVVQYTSLAAGQVYVVRLTTTPRLLRTVVREFDALAPTLSALGGTPPAVESSGGSRLAPAA